MSVTLYDDALLRKFKFWIKDDKLTILGVNESTDLFKYRLDQNNDKPLQLPIISLSRDPRMTILSTTKQPLTYDGYKVESKGGKTNQLNMIPIGLRYQLDIYTRYDYEGQEYAMLIDAAPENEEEQQDTLDVYLMKVVVSDDMEEFLPADEDKMEELTKYAEKIFEGWEEEDSDEE